MKKTTIVAVAAIVTLASLTTRAETKDKREAGPFVGPRAETTDKRTVLSFKHTREVQADKTSKEQLALRKELEKTIIPSVEFHDTHLRDAAKVLSEVSGKKFNIVATGANDVASPKITLSARYISLYEALRLVCRITGSELCIDDHAVVIVCDKGTPPNTYGVKLKIAPVEGLDNQFDVEFRIAEKQANGNENLLSTPRIRTVGGSEGIIKVLDENEDNGVICVATVTPREDALQVDTSVTIKRDGKVLWSCEQNTTVVK